MLGSLSVASLAATKAAVGGLPEQLALAAPSANEKVLALATHALACAKAVDSDAAVEANTLSVIDYSRPSTEPRFWVFDLASRQLLFEERVAHGRNTGENMARHFSNTPGSLMSSIGAFVTAGTYLGHNGYSLRLRGLEPGFNDNALERAIVIHGAPYVSVDIARAQNRLGRSFGCPAVRPAVARKLIDTIRNGSFVFAYYPDETWLQTSRLLGNCDLASATR